MLIKLIFGIYFLFIHNALKIITYIFSNCNELETRMDTVGYIPLVYAKL